MYFFLSFFWSKPFSRNFLPRYAHPDKHTHTQTSRACYEAETYFPRVRVGAIYYARH